MLLLSEVQANGGASHYISGHAVSHSTGFSVSVAGYEHSLPIDGLTQDDVDGLFNRMSVLIKAGNMADTHYVGAWIADGQFVMDISTWIPDFDDAVIFGKAGKQVAIFDFASMEEIFLDYD